MTQLANLLGILTAILCFCCAIDLILNKDWGIATGEIILGFIALYFTYVHYKVHKNDL